MENSTKVILAIVLAGLWISLSEFLRNEFILKHYWINHYKTLGLEFPSESINGFLWAVWSFILAFTIYLVSRKFNWLESALISWLMSFVLMWLVIGNMGVLPLQILYPAVPLSLIEVFFASFIVDQLTREKVSEIG